MLDASTTLLIGINVLQMVSILVLLFPLFNLDLIATCIKNFKVSFQTSSQFRFWCAFYCVFIALFGIVAPIRTLNVYGSARDNESSREKLIRIIQTTNAARNYILGGFSLFFLLVELRLFDFVIFSAKLQEFSVLMSNYHLIDITFSEIEEKESHLNLFIDDIQDDDSSDIIGKDKQDIGHWPSFINLRKLERVKIRKFLQSLESDTWSKEGKLSRRGSVDKTPTANTIEIPTKEEGVQVNKKSLRSVTLPAENHRNKIQLDENGNKERLHTAKESFRILKERFSAGVERVHAWKERAYDDKERFYIGKEGSCKKHGEGSNEIDYDDNKQASTSVSLATNSTETSNKSLDTESAERKNTKGRIVKRDFFRFR